MIVARQRIDAGTSTNAIRDIVAVLALEHDLSLITRTGIFNRIPQLVRGSHATLCLSLQSFRLFAPEARGNLGLESETARRAKWVCFFESSGRAVQIPLVRGLFFRMARPYPRETPRAAHIPLVRGLFFRLGKIVANLLTRKRFREIGFALSNCKCAAGASRHASVI